MLWQIGWELSIMVFHLKPLPNPKCKTYRPLYSNSSEPATAEARRTASKTQSMVISPPVHIPLKINGFFITLFRFFRPKKLNFWRCVQLCVYGLKMSAVTRMLAHTRTWPFRIYSRATWPDKKSSSALNHRFFKAILGVHIFYWVPLFA